MNEEELLKQRKLLELQAQLQQQLAIQEEISKAKMLEEVKERILREMLTKEAKERLNNVKLAKPELTEQIELYLIQLYQHSKILKPITDSQLKQILEEIAKSSKKDIKIRRL